MWRKVAIPTLMGLPLVAITGWVATTNAHFFAFVGTAALVVFVLPFLILGSSILFALRLSTRPDWMRWLAGVLTAAGILILLMIPTVLLGDWIVGRRIERAKAETAPLIAALERHRAEHGRYPEEIALPRSLERLGGSYYATTDGLEFSIWLDDPREFFASWLYVPGTGWVLED